MEWPMFHHDAQHTGLYTDPGSLLLFNPIWVKTDGTSKYMTFGFSGDIDWAAFHAVAGHMYQITVTPNSPGISPIFYLYAPDAKTVIGYGYSVLTKLLNETGIYYIKIENQLSGIGSYSISIVDITPTQVPPELWKNY